MTSDEARKHTAVRLALATLLKGEFEVDNLFVGDFAALDTPLSLGIERKSFTNLVQSLASNELDEQLSKMVDVYDIPVLLVEGLPVPVGGKVRVYGAQRSYAYAWIMASIVGWHLRGVLPIFVKDLKATPPTVAALYGVAKKLTHRDTFAPKKVLPNLRPMSLTERVLLQFPGVGEKRVKQFRGESLAALATLPVEDWQEKLGKVTGRKVAEAWGNFG